jgi:hypothetical protein
MQLIETVWQCVTANLPKAHYASTATKNNCDIECGRYVAPQTIAPMEAKLRVLITEMFTLICDVVFDSIFFRKEFSWSHNMIFCNLHLQKKLRPQQSRPAHAHEFEWRIQQKLSHELS